MRYYFLGIGGIGMSALARYFKYKGHNVSGYDRTCTLLTKQLEQEGIAVHYEDNPALLPRDVDEVVYTPAIPNDNKEYLVLRKLGVPIKKRSQVLGELTDGKRCIAVAGSHGKTTTSAMIAYLLNCSKDGCTAFLGGIAKNFNSNLVINENSPWVVVEADEYDRSFLQLHPYYSIITATDADHLDIYGTYQHLLEAFSTFANQTHPEGRLFLKEHVGENNAISHEHHEEHEHIHHGLNVSENITIETYSIESLESNYYAVNIRHYRGDIYFDLRTPNGVLYDMQLTQAPLYNVENATVAAAVAFACGLSEHEVRYGLKNFAGIRRRFDYHINDSRMVYIDDYAHHPKELEATIASVKYLYPEKRIVGVFQPHLYSRTADLYKEFAAALTSLDEVILMDIYPAREKPIPGVSSRLIMNEIPTMNRYLIPREEVPQMCVALCADVVLSMGAGDIDKEVPKIEQALRENM